MNCDEAELKPVDTVGLIHSLLLDMLNIMKLNAKSRNKWLRIQVDLIWAYRRVKPALGGVTKISEIGRRLLDPSYYF